MTKTVIAFASFALWTCSLALAGESLVRFHDDAPAMLSQFVDQNGGTLELVSKPGQLYKWTSVVGAPLRNSKNIVYIQANRKFGLFPNPSLEANRAALRSRLENSALNGPAYKDNPAIQKPGVQTAGTDPLLNQSWGLAKIAAPTGWKQLPQGKGIIVAVTDTGVDYNHADLLTNMWRNPGEIDGDGLDNDGNGFVDDIVGWDFATNDNKPYDLSMSLMDIVISGGNPGHGTHVAGVVGSRLGNAKGTAGVAPQVQIMALRFITEKGQGTDEAAIKSIDYAVQNGAHIINASWGGEKGEEDDSALQEAIARAEARGVIFVAAAGNGRANPAAGTSAGFDNDSDAKPMVPASFDHANIIAVAAMDSGDALAPFSNWGHRTVDVGAPGVKVLSTVPGSRYQDTILDFGSLKVTWDGTSMAAPHVAGTLAAIWSQKPSLTGSEVRDILFANTVRVSALSGKVATEGRIDMANIR